MKSFSRFRPAHLMPLSPHTSWSSLDDVDVEREIEIESIEVTANPPSFATFVISSAAQIPSWLLCVPKLPPAS